MKVFKMNKLELLKSEIKNKINFIEDQMMKLRKTDGQVLDKIPDYLDTITHLKKENSQLKANREQLDEEHSKDLEKVESLVTELLKMKESNDA
jgi:chromosome segregation ATPase